MQENKLKWALLSLFLSSLRRSVPEDYRSTYLVSTQSLEYLKEVRPRLSLHIDTSTFTDHADVITAHGHVQQAPRLYLSRRRELQNSLGSRIIRSDRNFSERGYDTDRRTETSG